MTVQPPEVRAVARKLACWCGGCSHLPVGECTCGHCAVVRAEIAVQLKAGKTEKEILQGYVEKFGGQQVLGEPLNQGIGRMVWLVPYTVGVLGLFAAVGVARRWSSKRPALAGAPNVGAADDGTLSARLDDELRDLD